jgi:GT2 family glycosyltransferase
LAHSESDVCVAILNWNGLHHLQQFLPDVVSNSGHARIRVIDNASTDASVLWIRSEFPDVELDILDKNYGFTGGYNRGIANLDAPLVVLLNSDVSVKPGWLNPLLECMNRNERIAACQPKILSWKEPAFFEYAGACGGFADRLGYPFCRGRMFHVCEEDKGQYQEAMPVFWASGACMMVRKEIFLQAGGLEEGFFAHMEEIDLCWRLWHRGFEVWVEPASEVLHLGAGTLSKSSPRKTFLNFRNGLSMLFINNKGMQAWWLLIQRLLLDGLAGLQFLSRGEFRNCLAIIRAHFSFYGKIPYWIKRQRENAGHSSMKVPENVQFKGSIIWQHFLLGKKRFSDLSF